MLLEKKEINDILVINFKENTNIVAENVTDFKKLLKSLLQENSYRIILNCEKLEFLDSSGIGALLSCLKLAVANNGWLKIANITDPVKQVFDLIKLNKIIPIFNSIEDALATQ